MLEDYKNEAREVALSGLRKEAGCDELPQEAIDFVEKGLDSAMEKMASAQIPLKGMKVKLLDAIKNATKDSSSLYSAAAQKIGQGLTGAAIGAGLMAGGKAFKQSDKMLKRNNYEKALNLAIQRSQVLQGADQAKVRRFGDTIFKFAPNVSTDPNLLANILSNAIHYESMDLVTTRALADLEKRYQDNNSINLSGMMV